MSEGNGLVVGCGVGGLDGDVDGMGTEPAVSNKKGCSPGEWRDDGNDATDPCDMPELKKIRTLICNEIDYVSVSCLIIPNSVL